MRNTKLLIAALLSIVPAQAQTPAADNAKTLLIKPIADSPSLAKRALIIGVQRYEAARPLTTCTRDARAVAELLRTKFGFPPESITLMTDDPGMTPPTYTRLLRTINAFVAGINEQSEVVVFFSGHGAGLNDEDWLVPLDGDPADIANTCISYDKLKNRIATRLPRRALLIVDACRNLQDGKDIASSGFGAGKAATGPEMAELLSCRRTEISREGRPDDFQNGVFTHFLIKGLSGEADAVAAGSEFVTFDSLKTYMQSKVSQYVASRLKAAQNPDGRATLGSMVLARGAAKPGIGPVVDVLTTARLRITTNPPGATVVVDQQRGVSPCEIEVDLGLERTKTVELGVQLAGYKTVVQRVTLQRGQVAPLLFNLVPQPVPFSPVPPTELPSIPPTTTRPTVPDSPPVRNVETAPGFERFIDPLSPQGVLMSGPLPLVIKAPNGAQVFAPLGYKEGDVIPYYPLFFSLSRARDSNWGYRTGTLGDRVPKLTDGGELSIVKQNSQDLAREIRERFARVESEFPLLNVNETTELAPLLNRISEGDRIPADERSADLAKWKRYLKVGSLRTQQLLELRSHRQLTAEEEAQHSDLESLAKSRPSIFFRMLTATGHSSVAELYAGTSMESTFRSAQMRWQDIFVRTYAAYFGISHLFEKQTAKILWSQDSAKDEVALKIIRQHLLNPQDYIIFKDGSESYHLSKYSFDADTDGVYYSLVSHQETRAYLRKWQEKRRKWRDYFEKVHNNVGREAQQVIGDAREKLFPDTSQGELGWGPETFKPVVRLWKGNVSAAEEASQTLTGKVGEVVWLWADFNSDVEPVNVQWNFTRNGIDFSPASSNWFKRITLPKEPGAYKVAVKFSRTDGELLVTKTLTLNVTP